MAVLQIKIDGDEKKLEKIYLIESVNLVVVETSIATGFFSRGKKNYKLFDKKAFDCYSLSPIATFESLKDISFSNFEVFFLQWFITTVFQLRFSAVYSVARKVQFNITDVCWFIIVFNALERPT